MIFTKRASLTQVAGRCLALALLAGGVGSTACSSKGSSSSNTDGTQSGSQSSTVTLSSSGGSNGTSSTTSMSGGSGSSGGASCPSGSMVSFAADVQPIFNAYCTTGCHESASGATWPTLPLTADMAYGLIVGKTSTETLATGMNIVEPGSLDKSFMWHKLNGTQDQVGLSLPPASNLAMPPPTCPPEGYPMPPACPMKKPPLADADLSTIKEWIVCGAAM